MAIAHESDTTSVGSSTVAFMGTINADDLLICIQKSRTVGSVPTKVLGTGFTQIDTGTNGSDTRYVASYKIAAGTETGNLTGMNGGSRNMKALLRFSGGITGVTIKDTDNEITNGNPASDTVTSGSGTAPLLVIAVFSGTNVLAPTFSPTEGGQVDTGDDVNDSLEVWWKIYESSPANVTADLPDEGARNIVATFYLELTAGSPVTVAVGQATETSTAQPVVVVETVAAGLAAETDTAFPVTFSFAWVLGQATETDTAFPVTGLETVAVGLANETDTAFSVSAVNVVNVGLATETDIALSVGVEGDVVVLAWPAINIAKVTMGLRVNTSVFSSAVTRDQGIQEINAGTTDRWEGVIEVPAMLHEDAKVLEGFVLKLKGRKRSFTFLDPDYSTSSSFPGAGAVNGANQKGRLLITDGWAADTTVLTRGKRIQVESQYYMITADATTNGSGQVTLDIEPPIRTSPADGAAVITFEPKITAVLAMNKVEFTKEVTHVHPVALAFEEVL